MTPKTFSYEACGQILIIHLPKEFDHHNCRNLKYETDLLLAENYIRKIVFDFSRTEFMDSSGIGVTVDSSDEGQRGQDHPLRGQCPGGQGLKRRGNHPDHRTF